MEKSPIIQIEKMNKTFPGVKALDNVNLTLYPGEVHSLVGENGAGKSTIIKIISGVYDYTEGTYLLNGEDAKIKSPIDAIKQGISVIYQELNLVSTLSIAENIFFGRLPAKAGKVQWKLLYRETEKYLKMVGLDVSPKLKVQYLSVAKQQLVEIAKAISLDAKVIIMDEPTSALSPNEIECLFAIVKQLKSQNVAIMYVSHKLDEIFVLSDKISVFRDGCSMGTINASEIDQQGLIEKMVGRKVEDMYPDRKEKHGDILLEVKNLNTDKVTDINFYVKKGEIVGFSGLMGAGRTEMTLAVFGIDKRHSGSIKMQGKEVGKNSALAARDAGIGLVVEDRKLEGILPNLSVKKNMSIVSLKQFSNHIKIKSKLEIGKVDELIKRLNIKTPSMDQLISKLSGGNQQKVLLARWLIKEELKLLMIDEPTRGIDVGAKAEIYQLINELANQGLSIVIVSSELPEILGICDRIYVMKDGKITGEFNKYEASEAKLLQSAIH